MSKQLPEELQAKIKEWASANAATEATTFDETRYVGIIDGAWWMAEQLVEAQERINVLETALKNIQHPLKYLQEQANAEGSRLNGIYPVQLSESAAFLKGIAAKALSPNNKMKQP